MAKKRKNKTRLIISIIVAVGVIAVAWTNELLDWLIKLGFENVSPEMTSLITIMLGVISAGWVLWEIVE